MAVRKRRSQSQKDPIGYTKSEIIVYVANKQEATTTDIRAYLRKEKNIRSGKNVRKHLSDLIDENVLSI